MKGIEWVSGVIKMNMKMIMARGSGREAIDDRFSNNLKICVPRSSGHTVTRGREAQRCLIPADDLSHIWLPGTWIGSQWSNRASNN